MKRCMFLGTIAVLGLLPLCQAGAQFMTMPSPDGSITVSASGNADADADWAELNIALDGHGPSAQEALFNCVDVCGRASAALEKQGVAKADVHVGLPRIAGSNAFEAMMPPGEGKNDAERFTVSNSLTVRIDKVNPATIYDEVCKLLDAVMTVKGAEMRHPEGVRDFMSSNDIVSFGVNDPKPLRDKAIANALDSAKELAQIVAAKAGKKLGPLVGVSIQGPENGGAMMAVMGMFAGPPKPGRGTYAVMLSATYKLE